MLHVVTLLLTVTLASCQTVTEVTISGTDPLNTPLTDVTGLPVGTPLTEMTGLPVGTDPTVIVDVTGTPVGTPLTEMTGPPVGITDMTGTPVGTPLTEMTGPPVGTETPVIDPTATPVGTPLTEMTGPPVGTGPVTDMTGTPVGTPLTEMTGPTVGTGTPFTVTTGTPIGTVGTPLTEMTRTPIGTVGTPLTEMTGGPSTPISTSVSLTSPSTEITTPMTTDTSSTTTTTSVDTTSTTTTTALTTVTSTNTTTPVVITLPPIIIPITTTRPWICGNPGETDVCHYLNTTIQCDVCDRVLCPSNKKCVKTHGACTPSCICKVETDIEDEHGICRNPCYQNPCQNGGTCVVDVTKLKKYRCECTNEFEGEVCEEMHNFCLDPSPSFCPAGQYSCQMLGFRNYTCECAEGFVYNVSGKECVKVGQRVNITLIFRDTYYAEWYNNITHPDAIAAKRIITNAFERVFGSNLISLIFGRFTEGSLIAHLLLLLKLHNSGEFRNNERIFKQFLLDCDTSNAACFDTLGKAYLPYDGWIARDERCGNIVCPQYTECEAIDGQPGKTKCVCASGFQAVGSRVDDQNRTIEICEDIDECALYPCPTVEECKNTPGGFICTRDPTVATCPSGSTIVVTGPYSYRCECSWIYAGSDCRFPLTLILLILACIFLLTTLAVGIFMYLQKKRNRSGTYQLYSVPDGMSSTKTVESSWK